MRPITRCLASALLALTACNPHTFERVLMASAYRPDAAPAVPPYVVLAGDMHCHVSPPDVPDDVTRDVQETLALARDEHLDFVVFTPHLGARFFMDPGQRAAALAGQEELRRNIEQALAKEIPVASATGARLPILVRGFEYTDHDFGHVGASFADLAMVLNEVPVEAARANPALFFERWVAADGLLVVNHPVVTPLDSVLARARTDMSWRPWTAPQKPIAPEILAVHRLAVGFEAYNAAVSRMRDSMFAGDASLSLREVTSRVDLEIHTSGRRIALAGGSDSHAGYLRAAVFVLANARTADALHDGIVQGRTCVKSPDACTLQVRAPGGPWVSVGGTVRSAGEVEVRATGEGGVTVFRDGAPVATQPSAAIGRVAVPPGLCSLVRVQVGEGYSSPVYVNCPFAER
jgi:hypothetical protein